MVAPQGQPPEVAARLTSELQKALAGNRPAKSS
jgi:hypothetical protein